MSSLPEGADIHVALPVEDEVGAAGKGAIALRADLSHTGTCGAILRSISRLGSFGRAIDDVACEPCDAEDRSGGGPGLP